MRIIYDPKADALHILFQEATVTTEELADGIAADYDAEGRLAGIEILDAAQRLGGRDSLRQITLEGFGQVVPVWRSEDKSTYYAEALTWLQQGGSGEDWRSVGDSSERLTPEASLRLVQELYAAGAAQVRVEGRYLDEEGESADYLEIILPHDAAARSILFGIGARVLRETGSGFDPAVEQGQTSFTIGW